MSLGGGLSSETTWRRASRTKKDEGRCLKVCGAWRKFRGETTWCWKGGASGHDRVRGAWAKRAGICAVPTCCVWLLATISWHSSRLGETNN